MNSDVNVSPLGIAGVITEEFHPDLWTRACARQHHFPARCAAAHSTKGTNAGNRCTQVGKTTWQPRVAILESASREMDRLWCNSDTRLWFNSDTRLRLHFFMMMVDHFVMHVMNHFVMHVLHITMDELSHRCVDCRRTIHSTDPWAFDVAQDGHHGVRQASIGIHDTADFE